MTTANPKTKDEEIEDLMRSEEVEEEEFADGIEELHLALEAAQKRIEKLEGLIRELVEAMDKEPPSADEYPPVNDWYQRARQALKGHPNG